MSAPQSHPMQSAGNQGQAQVLRMARLMNLLLARDDDGRVQVRTFSEWREAVRAQPEVARYAEGEMTNIIYQWILVAYFEGWNPRTLCGQMGEHHRRTNGERRPPAALFDRAMQRLRGVPQAPATNAATQPPRVPRAPRAPPAGVTPQVPQTPQAGVAQPDALPSQGFMLPPGVGMPPRDSPGTSGPFKSRATKRAGAPLMGGAGGVKTPKKQLTGFRRQPTPPAGEATRGDNNAEGENVDTRPPATPSPTRPSPAQAPAPAGYRDVWATHPIAEEDTYVTDEGERFTNGGNFPVRVFNDGHMEYTQHERQPLPPAHNNSQPPQPAIHQPSTSPFGNRSRGGFRLQGSRPGRGGRTITSTGVPTTNEGRHVQMTEAQFQSHGWPFSGGMGNLRDPVVGQAGAYVDLTQQSGPEGQPEAVPEQQGEDPFPSFDISDDQLPDSEVDGFLRRMAQEQSEATGQGLAPTDEPQVAAEGQAADGGESTEADDNIGESEGQAQPSFDFDPTIDWFSTDLLGGEPGEFDFDPNAINFDGFDGNGDFEDEEAAGEQPTPAETPFTAAESTPAAGVTSADGTTPATDVPTPAVDSPFVGFAITPDVPLPPLDPENWVAKVFVNDVEVGTLNSTGLNILKPTPQPKGFLIDIQGTGFVEGLMHVKKGSKAYFRVGGEEHIDKRTGNSDPTEHQLYVVTVKKSIPCREVRVEVSAGFYELLRDGKYEDSDVHDQIKHLKELKRDINGKLYLANKGAGVSFEDWKKSSSEALSPRAIGAITRFPKLPANADVCTREACRKYKRENNPDSTMGFEIGGCEHDVCDFMYYRQDRQPRGGFDAIVRTEEQRFSNVNWSLIADLDVRARLKQVVEEYLRLLEEAKKAIIKVRQEEDEMRGLGPK